MPLTKHITPPWQFGVISAGTGSVASPQPLTAYQSGQYFTNRGATAMVAFSLPAASTGARYIFICVDDDGMRISATGGDTITQDDNESAANGYIETTVLGAMIEIVATSATQWSAVGGIV